MVELNNIGKNYGRKTALNAVTLELGDGVYGLLGPNGAGKTTLIRILAGLLRPTTGTVSGVTDMGYLPQKFGMFKALRVYEAMEYFASLKKIPQKEQKGQILDCLEQVRLSDRAGDKVGALSGGMVRRLGIAQALLGNPAFLLVDEPTAGLDPEERLRFKNLMMQLRSGRTILISTHIVEDVESVCDHILILHNGRLLAQGTAEDIRQAAAGKVYLLPEEEKGQLREPWLLLREEGERLRILSDEPQNWEPVSPTVEDGYMFCIHHTQ